LESKNITEREQILKNVRKALIRDETMGRNVPDIDFQSEIYKYNEKEGSGLVNFAEAFIHKGGNFIFCKDVSEFILELKAIAKYKKWKTALTQDEKLMSLAGSASLNVIDTKGEIEKADVGITFCEAMVERTGSILVSALQNGGRMIDVFPPVHIVLGYTSAITKDLSTAYKALLQKYEGRIPSMVSLISGPAKTADIEQKIVKGAHGPEEIFLFLIDDTN
jgi:L-lactate dehydrogenase complex protein LldG